MRIRIRVLSHFSIALGFDESSFIVPEGITLGEMKETLIDRFSTFIRPIEIGMYANMRPEDDQYVLKDGDTIYIFPRSSTP